MNTIYKNIPEEDIIMEEKLNKDLELSKEKVEIKKENKYRKEEAILISKLNKPMGKKNSSEAISSNFRRETINFRSASPKECYINTNVKKVDA